jgi:hypothetical protein
VVIGIFPLFTELQAMAYIEDGFSTTIDFAAAPNVKFKEVGVTPPGIDGGGPVNTTTMRNTEWRTQNPKHLKTLTPMTGTFEYDPAVYDDIVAMCNVNQQITVHFPDGSTLLFWGWLDKFTPGENKEGERPTASVTIECSNQNASQDETAPVYSAA